MFTLSSAFAELLPKGSKEEQRDYVFYLAVGNYRLKVRRSSLLPPPRALGGPQRPLASPPGESPGRQGGQGGL